MTEEDIWWDKFRIDNLNKIIKMITTENEVKDFIIQIRKAELIKKQKQIDGLKRDIEKMYALCKISYNGKSEIIDIINKTLEKVS